MANVNTSQPHRRVRAAMRTLLAGVCAAAAVMSASELAHADVSLGVLIPSSGKGAAYGIQQQNAIEMFMEKYSDLGKAGKLKLIIYDTRGENTEAINLTRKLIRPTTSSRSSARSSARRRKSRFRSPCAARCRS